MIKPNSTNQREITSGRMTQRRDQLRTHLWPAVRPPVDDLRGRVEWTATEGLQQLVLMVKVGQSKVSNLQKPRTRELY